MNVLGKVVIPRSKLSIKYILDELEELAREDFFRLKKVMNMKERNRKLKHAHKEIIPTCPVCLKMMKEAEGEVETCISCGKPLEPAEEEEEEPEESEEQKLEDKNKLEELKTRLEEIAELKKSVEERKLMSPSMEEFLANAEDVKAKLEERLNKEEPKIIVPPDTNLEEYCAKCQKMIVIEEAIDEDISGSKDMLKPEETDAPQLEDVVSKVTIKAEKKAEPLPLTHLYEHETPVEQPELGIFETEIKEIVKIIRTKNEDGTITEEKKVLKIKKEIREPKRPERDASGKLMFQASEASTKSNPYSNSKTVGVIEIKPKDYFLSNTEYCAGPSKANNSNTSMLDLEQYCNEHDNTIDKLLEKLNDTTPESSRDIEELLHLLEPLTMLHKVSVSTETYGEQSETSNLKTTEIKDDSTQCKQTRRIKFKHVSLSDSDMQIDNNRSLKETCSDSKCI